jgi:hypothetical protein
MIISILLQHRSARMKLTEMWFLGMCYVGLVCAFAIFVDEYASSLFQGVHLAAKNDPFRINVLNNADNFF